MRVDRPKPYVVTALDPTKTVGKWSIGNVSASASLVVHDYDGGGASHAWAVCQDPGPVNFCGASIFASGSMRGAASGTNFLGATVVYGQVACAAVRGTVKSMQR